MSAHDPRLEAIRADRLVGRGTCTGIDEGFDDADLVRELDRGEITTSAAAVSWARDREGLRLENATNATSGEPDCPLVAAATEWLDQLAKPCPICGRADLRYDTRDGSTTCVACGEEVTHGSP